MKVGNKQQDKSMTKVMRVLGIDVGKYKTGVAIGQSLTGTAQPLDIVKSPINALTAAHFAPYIEQWGAKAIVIGEPKLADGKPHPLSDGIERLCALLVEQFNLPVYRYDEYLSSHDAQKLKPSRRQIDDLAAVVILESWFASQ